MLTLESVSSAHFCTSQNVSIRALATLFKVSSELLASCLTASSSAAGRALTKALAPSRGATGKRTWSARAQPFLHRASSSEDFCFSMSLQQTHRALRIKPLQETTENPHTAVLDSSADHGAAGVLLNGSSIGPWIRLHGEVNSQSRLVDVGEDDVRCWYHLGETLHALLSRSNTGGGVRRALFTLWTITCPYFPPTRSNVTFSESSWWSRCTCRGR